MRINRVRERALRNSVRAEKRGIVSQGIYQTYSRLVGGDKIKPRQSICLCCRKIPNWSERGPKHVRPLFDLFDSLIKLFISLNQYTTTWSPSLDLSAALSRILFLVHASSASHLVKIQLEVQHRAAPQRSLTTG